MRQKRDIPPTGELRQSQVITTFGPGAMLDLPDHSVLVGGLEQWKDPIRKRISEPRLEAKVKSHLKLESIALYRPPVDVGDPNGPRTGISVFLFPTWFLAQVEMTYEAKDGSVYRTRPLLPYDLLVKGKYQTLDRKLKPVVPIRFVQACVHGHISDIDWYGFVGAERGEPLFFDEGGSANVFAELFVRRPRTGERRPLSDAAVPANKVLGICRGRQPWLGPHVFEDCDKPNRLLVRSASNAYFSQTLSVIAIPDADADVRDAVDRIYEDYLQYAENLADVTRERRKEKVSVALEGLTDAQVWADIERRRGGVQTGGKKIKEAEFATIVGAPSSLTEDLPDGDFYARNRVLDSLPHDLKGKLSNVVLVHRLREVMAQVGFTRFESAMPDIDGELSLEVSSAPLSRDAKWVPAVENRGEGIFIAFSKEAIDAWMQVPAVIERGRHLDSGFEDWKERRQASEGIFPGLPYIMLHSLSHLLITTVALDCGYSASAIRERIYAGEYGYGILLYTGSSGSEGTLGGLVAIGKRIETYISRAIEFGRLCSNDPVCAQHLPDDPHEERFLHGAACHGCLLIAETSCEQRNLFLDRALVVPTVTDTDVAFFGDSV